MVDTHRKNIFALNSRIFYTNTTYARNFGLRKVDDSFINKMLNIISKVILSNLKNNFAGKDGYMNRNLF